MKKNFLLLLSFLLLNIISAQQIDSIIALPLNLSETSGLLYFNQKLISHTDSGGENELYEIDSISGQIARTVYIENAINVDWEDIAQDDDFIYIADIGNNQGNRTDLKIYILSKQDYVSSINDTVSVTEINFSYSNQTNFASQNQNTNFDAEALLCFGDSLYIFTKNWINQETNVYRLPKIAGTFSAELIDSFDVGGMITGASLNADDNKILLCGYTKLGSSFLFEMKEFNDADFFSASNTRIDINLKGSVQVEGICHAWDNKYYMSSESFFTTPAVLHQLIDTSSVNTSDTINSVSSIIDEVIFYPNPIQDKLNLPSEYDYFEVYNSNAECVLKTSEYIIDTKNWRSGIYFVRCFQKNKLSHIIKLEKL